MFVYIHITPMAVEMSHYVLMEGYQERIGLFKTSSHTTNTLIMLCSSCVCAMKAATHLDVIIHKLSRSAGYASVRFWAWIGVKLRCWIWTRMICRVTNIVL